MPRLLINCAAFPVGACRLSIICLRLVPASLPLIPAFAISPMAVTMSSTGTLALANTDEAICMASPTSLTSAALALAAAASRSATRLASDPASPNELSAAAATCAACPVAISPAAANCSTPLAASIESFTLRPALPSSTIASAASLALVPGIVRSLPRAIATACIAAICADVAPVTLWKMLILVWNVAAAVMAEVPIANSGADMPAVMRAPTPTIASPAPCTEALADDSPLVSPDTSADTLTSKSPMVLLIVAASPSPCRPKPPTCAESRPNSTHQTA